MDAFKAKRDINIKDSSVTVNQQKEAIKPIAFLTTEELFQERTHRQKLVDKERKRQHSHVPILFLIAIILGLFTFICQQYFEEYINPFVLLFTGLGTMGSIYLALQTLGTKSLFEQRQLEVLEEISMILKEREV